MNYSTLQSTYLARLGMSTSDPAAGNAASDINESLHYIETLVPDGWPWMRATYNFSTVTNTATYAFTAVTSTPALSTVLDMKILRQSNYYERLDLISPHEAELNYPSTVTGIPEAFYVEASTIYFYPTPNAAYSVRVRATSIEPDLSFGGSSPVMPTVYHSAIVEGALMLMYERLQDSTRLAVAQNRLDQYIQRMRVNSHQFQGSPRITVREWL